MLNNTTNDSDDKTLIVDISDRGSIRIGGAFQ